MAREGADLADLTGRVCEVDLHGSDDARRGWTDPTEYRKPVGYQYVSFAKEEL